MHGDLSGGLAEIVDDADTRGEVGGGNERDGGAGLLEGSGDACGCDGDLCCDGGELESDVVGDDVGTAAIEVLADTDGKPGRGCNEDEAAGAGRANLERSIRIGRYDSGNAGALNELDASAGDSRSERISYSAANDNGMGCIGGDGEWPRRDRL